MRRARPDLGFEEQAYSCQLARIPRTHPRSSSEAFFPHVSSPVDRLDFADRYHGWLAGNNVKSCQHTCLSYEA